MPGLADACRAVADGDTSSDALLAAAEALTHALAAIPPGRLAEIEDHLGRPPHTLLAPIRDAADPAARRAAAEQLAAQGCGCGDTAPEPTSAQEDDAAELLARRALAPVVHLITRGLL